MTNLPQDIPIAIILIPYALFVVVYLFFIAFNLFHLWRYGIDTWQTHALIFLYIAGTILIAYGTFVLLVSQDWTTAIDFTKLFSPLHSKIFNKL